MKRLVMFFTYLDTIIVDTPILLDTFRAQIRNVFSIRERLERAEIFRLYLDTQWEHAGLPTSAFDWPTASNSLSNEIVEVQAWTSPGQPHL